MEEVIEFASQALPVAAGHRFLGILSTAYSIAFSKVMAPNQQKRISMSKSLMIAGALLGASCLPCMANDLYMYDQNGNYSYGNISPGGNVTMYDQNGNYTYGHVSPGY